MWFLTVDPLVRMCQVNMLKGKNKKTRFPSQPKTQNQIETNTTIARRDPLCSDIPEWLQESEKISWMMEFLNAETHTPVLLIKHL